MRGCIKFFVGLPRSGAWTREVSDEALQGMREAVCFVRIPLVAMSVKSAGTMNESGRGRVPLAVGAVEGTAGFSNLRPDNGEGGSDRTGELSSLGSVKYKNGTAIGTFKEARGDHQCTRGAQACGHERRVSADEWLRFRRGARSTTRRPRVHGKRDTLPLAEGEDVVVNHCFMPNDTVQVTMLFRNALKVLRTNGLM
jgi:hypothetical protein